MYGKIFDSMYDGTLADDWQALVTFQQLIVLATDDGVVDMTTRALSRRTGIPLEIIEAGIEVLEAEDASSRSPDRDGARIERLDAHREWGWSIVNHKAYRQLASHAEKKEADRKRLADKRAAEPKPSKKEECREVSQGVATCREVSASVADVAYTDTDTDTDTVKDTCPEPEKKSGSKPPAILPVFLIPLNDGSDHPVAQSDLDRWRTLYPAVDVPQEIRNMLGWLEGSPSKRKTKRGVNKFITGWLGREQDKGGSHAGNNLGNKNRAGEINWDEPFKLDQWDDYAREHGEGESVGNKIGPALEGNFSRMEAGHS